MSRLTVTLPAPVETLDAERIRFAEFAAKEAEPVYRQVAADLYRHWGRVNVHYFGGRLKEPHFTLGVTGPRSFGFCKALTDFGASLQITVSFRVVFGQHRLMRVAWPSQGIKRFVRDIVLHEVVHQWQHEVLANPESAYHGHGPRFCAECNRIGEELGLPAVIVRRRGQKGSGQPLCSEWPYSVRPEGFYLGDLDESPWRRRKRKRPRHDPDYLLLLEAILSYLRDGRVQELKEVLEAELELVYERRRHGVLEFPSILSGRGLTVPASAKGEKS